MLIGKISVLCLLGFLSLFLFLGVLDGEVAELVSGLSRSDNTDPVTDVVLLKELLGEVLQVLLRETSGGPHNNFVLLLLDDDSLPEVAGLTVHLDLSCKEGLLHCLIKNR